MEIERIAVGDRRAVIRAGCLGSQNEVNEEIMRTTLENAIRYYEENAPRGEYVLVVEGVDPSAQPCKEGNDFFASLSHQEHVAHYEGEGLTRMDAIKAAARDLGISKSELYRRLHQENN